jgi:hypothetical protein
MPAVTNGDVSCSSGVGEELAFDAIDEVADSVEARAGGSLVGFIGFGGCVESEGYADAGGLCFDGGASSMSPHGSSSPERG